MIISSLRIAALPPLSIWRLSTSKHGLLFPKEWGLGTSSTLIANIARVFKVNPYALLAATFGGSGYDIACATSESPLLFRLENGVASAENVTFSPVFAQNLYFVYLGKKQNSKEGIERYNRQKKIFGQRNIETLFALQITGLTQAFLRETDLKAFEEAIVVHEKLIAVLVQLPRAKTLYFNDFWGEIKSLGAWGGDFVLATSDRSPAETKKYFISKGFETVLTYNEIIL